MDSNICVIIPAFNEDKTIGNIVEFLRRDKIDVVVIDDCSSDSTAEVAKIKGAIVISHNRNLGKGSTLKDGIEYVKNKNYRGVVLMDADGQHDPSEVMKFCEFAEKNNSMMIIGNRMTNTKLMPFTRMLTNKIMSSLISSIVAQKLPDTQCGFRYLDMRLIRQLNLQTSNFEVETEIIIKVARLKIKIDSIPIRVIYDLEKSKINPFLDTWRFWVFLIKVFAKKI